MQQSTADATASAVDSLTTQVSQQGDILTSVGSRTTMLENGLNTTNGNVNKKADATALQTLQNTVTEQGKTLASQGSSLTQLNNSLNDATASLAADGKIPGNLISNGSFERGQEAFTGWGSVGSVISAQSPNYGSKIAMCGVGLAGISQKVPVVKGNTYKIGVFAVRRAVQSCRIRAITNCVLVSRPCCTIASSTPRTFQPVHHGLN